MIMRTWKAVSMIITAIAITTTVLFAQEGTGAEKKQTVKKIETKEYKDLNANGVDDAKEKAHPTEVQSGGMHDRFIDTNGDGICDNREQGLGFRRGNGTTTIQSGKRQQGRTK